MSASMTVEELRLNLKKLGLDSTGYKPQLRHRLKKAQAKQSDVRQHGASQGLDEEEPSLEMRYSWKPEYDTFLVLDVEATCERTRRYLPEDMIKQKKSNDKGHAFRNSYDYPNEIIEFPVVMLQWIEGEAGESDEEEGKRRPPSVEVKDIFHSYVKPSWRPTLSKFCRELTGIEQSQIDSAPGWPSVVEKLYSFLNEHDLLEQETASSSCPMYNTRLRSGVTWVTHGPYDLRDFVIKQSHISSIVDGEPGASTGKRYPFLANKLPPFFLRGPLIDIRRATPDFLEAERLCKVSSSATSSRPKVDGGVVVFGGHDGFQVVSAPTGRSPPPSPPSTTPPSSVVVTDRTLEGLLRALGLGEFEGRQHCGLDDTKNVARLCRELVRRISEISIPNLKAKDQGKKEEEHAEEELWRSQHQRCVRLEHSCLIPNTKTNKLERKKWPWMSSDGESIRWPWDAETDDQEREEALEQERNKRRAMAGADVK
ncbi:hypothetical protein IE53DRAFT_73557 [Violaceomyces palustris]|uniref:Uncharacterized protein n=1 Tax=Violaceomyces palustris TaxID=1673888 RepID=A0ACD0NZ48_9BASI|nr:hypothetical protein IE53DRAFT_73557 [Violaceomyces palustris]